MTNFSLVPRLHQSQPANHRNPRIQTKRLPLSSSVANPALIQTKLQKTTLSSTFKITSDNCASSISSSCCRHSSDFKTITPVSHCKRKQRVFFSAPMLTDESVHTARRGGAAARSRSRAGAAVPRSFRRRVYFCCAAYAQLKWQDIIYDWHSNKKTYLKCVNGM